MITRATTSRTQPRTRCAVEQQSRLVRTCKGADLSAFLRIDGDILRS